MQNRPPLAVEKFRKTTMRGWEYALNNMDEIIEIIFTQYNTQNKTKEHLKYEAKVLKKAYKSGICSNRT